MTSPTLAEGIGATRKHAAAMPQFAIDGLDHPRIGLTYHVSLGGQHLRAGTSGVGGVARILPVLCNACHRRVNVAVPREPCTQTTIRHEARQPTSQNQTLRYLLPANFHSSSCLRVSLHLRCAFRYRRRGSPGPGQCAYFSVWRPYCAPRPSITHCCPVSCAREAVDRLAHIAAPFRLRRIENNLGTWPARHYCSCGESAH